MLFLIFNVETTLIDGLFFGMDKKKVVLAVEMIGHALLCSGMLLFGLYYFKMASKLLSDSKKWISVVRICVAFAILTKFTSTSLLLFYLFKPQ